MCLHTLGNDGDGDGDGGSGRRRCSFRLDDDSGGGSNVRDFL